MKPIIVINKADLLEEKGRAEERALLEEFIAAYAPLGIPILLVSAAHVETLQPIREHMKGKSSLFSGQSGVGKSSLINAIFGKSLAVGPIVEKSNKGSHTTTSASLIYLGESTLCIDTPGIKSFGLFERDPKKILAIFPDFLLFAAKCRFPNCTHIHEPNCGVKEALEGGRLSTLRYRSYCALLSDPPPQEWE